MTVFTPLIGLSGRRGEAAMLGAPAGFGDSPLDIYMSEYTTSVIAAGGLPVHLPLDADPEALVARLDAVLLSGGEDVTPGSYGQEPNPANGPSSAERDAFERGLAEAAIARGIPVLGICRGAQLLNVMRGGTLIQHLPDRGLLGHTAESQPRTERSHPVDLVAGSVLAAVYGARTEVNTFHHQAIDALGRGVRVSATAPDGVIEGIEFEDAAVVATQWHPETFGNDPLFGWLIRAARTANTPKDNA